MFDIWSLDWIAYMAHSILGFLIYFSRERCSPNDACDQGERSSLLWQSIHADGGALHSHSLFFTHTALSSLWNIQYGLYDARCHSVAWAIGTGVHSHGPFWILDVRCPACFSSFLFLSFIPLPLLLLYLFTWFPCSSVSSTMCIIWAQRLRYTVGSDGCVTISISLSRFCASLSYLAASGNSMPGYSSDTIHVFFLFLLVFLYFYSFFHSLFLPCFLSNSVRLTSGFWIA